MGKITRSNPLNIVIENAIEATIKLTNIPSESSPIARFETSESKRNVQMKKLTDPAKANPSKIIRVFEIFL